VLKLDRFDNTELDANISVLQLVKLERGRERDEEEEDEQALILGVHGGSTPKKAIQLADFKLDSISEQSVSRLSQVQK